MAGLANGILGLLILPLLFVFLYGPDRFVEMVSPGYMCSQSTAEAIKAVRRDAGGTLSFGDFYSTSAINLNVPAPLLLSIFKMDTATNRKVGRVTYCTGILLQIFSGADTCSIQENKGPVATSDTQGPV